MGVLDRSFFNLIRVCAAFWSQLVEVTSWNSVGKSLTHLHFHILRVCLKPNHIFIACVDVKYKISFAFCHYCGLISHFRIKQLLFLVREVEFAYQEVWHNTWGTGFVLYTSDRREKCLQTWGLFSRVGSNTTVKGYKAAQFLIPHWFNLS